MFHLFVNALKFSRQNGKIEVRISFESFKNEGKLTGCLKTEVIDNGSGIEITKLAKLFETFNTVKLTDTYTNSNET